jgi:hypothetical protein
MTISTSRLTSAFRGGLHGEESTSHDGEKKHQEASTDRWLEAEPPTERSEVSKGRSWAQFDEVETASSDRQSQPSDENAAQGVAETDGGMTMTDGTSNLPKTGGQVARVAGQLFNDTRITNVLMLVLVLIGMGGAEAVQSQMCSL